MIRRRLISRFALLGVLSFALGFSYNYYLPKVEAYLLKEVERQSRAHSPVKIAPASLKFHLVPLGIVLTDVRVEPEGQSARYFAPATLKTVGARLAILPLIRGKVRLSRLYVQDSELNLFLREDLFEKKPAQTELRFDFDRIYNLPIDEIALENVRVQAKLEPQNVVFRVDQLDLLVENRYRSLFVELNAPKTLVKPSGPVAPLDVQLELRTLIEAREAQISAFKLRANESFVVASGRVNGDFETGRLDNGAFDARAKMRLTDLNIWERIFFLNPRLPALLGFAETDLALEVRAGKAMHLSGELTAKDFKFDKFFIGGVDARFQSDLKSLKSERILVSNDAGAARLNNLKIDWREKPRVEAEVVAENVNLSRLLHHLHVKEAPVLLVASGKGVCAGVLQDPIAVECEATITAPRLRIDSGEPKHTTIVDTADLRIKGSGRLTDKDFAWKATGQLGKGSSGSSDGVVNFDTGFKANYRADRLLLSDIKNLANLKLEGEGVLSGRTEGTAKWGTIDMHVDAKDFWLEDYPLGSFNTEFSYKAAHLNFKNAVGQYGVSRYNGDVGVDLARDRIKISLAVPFADLRDVQAMFQRKVELPIQVQGTGTGQIEANGPFAFRHMSYQVKSSFFRGEIAKETFDEFVFNVNSVDGNVTGQKIQITKSSGLVDVKGQINPAGEIDAVAVARGLRLEQSENVVGLGLDLQGLADVTMLIRGQLPRPRIELNGRLSRVVLADQPAEDSVFKLNFLADRMTGSGQFLGSRLLTDFSYPYNDQAPFLLKLKTRQWDFTTAFSLVSKSARQLDFSTSLTMDLNLSSQKGGFWASDGQAVVSEFSIRKGSKEMAAEKPMTATMRAGVVNSQGFAVTSGDSYLKLDMVNLERDKLNASLNGKMDLALLGLFTPFISDLRGIMSVSMDLRGTAASPSVSGSAYIDKGYAKFAEFYHPFSNVRADLLFNDNTIMLNAVRGEVAGGRLNGEGRLTFTDEKKTVDVRGTFNEVKINIPEGFRTSGSGTVAIKGDGFPYLMAIDYDVMSGEVIYEFGAPTNGDVDVKASAYLPRFLYQDAFHPFTFLVDVNLRNPILVNNSMARAPVTGRMKAEGTTDRLSLNGTLNPVPGGKVFFSDVPFEISSSYVEYENMPPNNPKIYLTANTRVTETVQDQQSRTSEHEYDVSLLVQGRGQDPQITLTSMPPLSQREIVSLLALGVTNSGMERRDNDYQASSTSSAIGAAILQKAGSRRLKESLGVDVKVSSSQPTDRAAQPKVTLSKQWTPKLGASASSTLAANPANDVKVEYKMNKNISVIGSWEGKETDLKEDDTTESVFGLDLEYRVQFK